MRPLPPKPTNLRARLAQLMVPRIGSNLDPVRTVDQDAERIERLLESCPVGGLILFNGRQHETARTVERLQSLCDTPLLVTADIERGLGQQVLGHPVVPHAMAFDALGDDAVAAVEEFARLTAEGARAAGIHVSFGPVADVNVDPQNPIIATRAFGVSPIRVAELVAAYVRGCAEAGVMSCAKHFPGHGNTHEDSHHGLPTVRATKEELHACELTPFKAAIDSGVDLLMTAHVRYPSLDGGALPATMSPGILIELLRGELGFRGAVVSDSLLMEGVTKQAEGEGALAAAVLNAGVDVLLDVADPPATLDALVSAVERGEVSEARVDEAFNRLWALKLKAAETVEVRSPDAIDQDVLRLSERVAAGAVVSPSGDAPKLDPAKPLCAIFLKPFQTHLDPAEQPLADALRERFAGVEYHELGPDSDEADYESATAAGQAAEQLLLAIVVKPAAWHRFGLMPRQNELVEKLCTAPHAVLACLGSPVGLERFSATRPLFTYSDVPASQIALAQALLG